MRHFALSFWKRVYCFERAFLSNRHFFNSFSLFVWLTARYSSFVDLCISFLKEKAYFVEVWKKHFFDLVVKKKEHLIGLFLVLKRKHSFCFWKRALALVFFPTLKKKRNIDFGFGKSIILCICFWKKIVFVLVFHFHFSVLGSEFTHSQPCRHEWKLKSTQNS